MAPKTDKTADRPGERIAKVIARAGVCSRREAEKLIAQGRVEIDRKTVESPAEKVLPGQKVRIDGEALPGLEPIRLFRLYKPAGVITTEKDPEGRQTVFDLLPPDAPRLLTVGRLDINSEGLLLLTNDGGLKRHLELPSTGWVRRYRVRVFGRVTEKMLEELDLDTSRLHFTGLVPRAAMIRSRSSSVALPDSSTAFSIASWGNMNS